MQVSPELEKKNISYFLKCVIKKKIEYGVERINGKQSEIQLVYLIPERNTQFVKFAKAYVPFGDLAKDIELPVLFPYPIADYCRVEFNMANEHFDCPYFRIMTMDIEDDFLRQKNLKTIQMEVLPFTEEEHHNI